MRLMLDPAQALAAANRPTALTTTPARRVLVLGGAGPLGSAVLERLLSTHRFERVGVVVTQPLAPALRGLSVVTERLADWAQLGADTAVIVFDRERRSFGREDAFLRPQPAALLTLARQLQQAGVRRLLVAVPHQAAMLPLALRAGLASLDEGAVAALGFEQLVFMRLASAGGEPSQAAGVASPPQRLAHWVLNQLHWMVPSDEQPVRAATVARVIAALVLAWPEASRATRVLPPTLLWHAAQGADVTDLVERWLAGEPLAPIKSPQRRW
jgi:hypothetical protein